MLGLAHAFATPQSVDRPRGLSPRDPELARAMSQATVRLTRRTDLWRAWVGFNLSHSLGAVLFGVVVLAVGYDPATFALQAPVFVPLALVVSLVYVVLAVRYWFSTPIAGCVLGAALFAATFGLRLAGG